MNQRTTVILFIALVVLGGIAYYLNANPEADGKTPTPSAAASERLWEVASGAGEVKAFSVIDNVNNVTFTAEYLVGGTFKIDAPRAGEADQQKLNDAYLTIGALYINRTITETTDLTDFGLLKPDYTIVATTVDGRTLTASVGKKSPTGSGYYVLRSGESNAVVVTSYGLDLLLALPMNPPFATPSPAATVETLPGLPLIGTPGSP